MNGKRFSFSLSQLNTRDKTESKGAPSFGETDGGGSAGSLFVPCIPRLRRLVGLLPVEVAVSTTPARIDAASTSAFQLARFATRVLSSPATHLKSQ